MGLNPDLKQWQDDLVHACKDGNETHARALVMQLGPRKARAALEAMLDDPDVLVRQAAVFGLGELGGAANARLLEQQLAIEEARGDYDGASVGEAITRALGQLKQAGARSVLLRRLRRLAPGKSVLSEVNPLARALWCCRDPELLPAVRDALARLALPGLNSLHGLLLLLEKPPEELRRWLQDMSVPVEHKTEVLTVLEEEVPAPWLPTLPVFSSVAQSLLDAAVSAGGAASYYCERLLILLLRQERVLEHLSPEAMAALSAAARRLLAARSLACAMRAADLLVLIGTPEDAPLVEAHRPADPILAKAFDEVAQALRRRGEE